MVFASLPPMPCFRSEICVMERPSPRRLGHCGRAELAPGLLRLNSGPPGPRAPEGAKAAMGAHCSSGPLVGVLLKLSTDLYPPTELRQSSRVLVFALLESSLKSIVYVLLH